MPGIYPPPLNKGLFMKCPLPLFKKLNSLGRFSLKLLVGFTIAIPPHAQFILITNLSCHPMETVADHRIGRTSNDVHPRCNRWSQDYTYSVCQSHNPLMCLFSWDIKWKLLATYMTKSSIMSVFICKFRLVLKWKCLETCITEVNILSISSFMPSFICRFSLDLNKNKFSHV